MEVHKMHIYTKYNRRAFLYGWHEQSLGKTEHTIGNILIIFQVFVNTGLCFMATGSIMLLCIAILVLSTL